MTTIPMPATPAKGDNSRLLAEAVTCIRDAEADEGTALSFNQVRLAIAKLRTYLVREEGP